MREYWPRLIVLWVNTGDAFPETIKQMEGIKRLVPHFMEVKADQPAQIAADGYPSDIVSIWDTPIGRQSYPGRQFRTQTAMACCCINIWYPAAEAVKRLGATLVIRGQRRSESRLNQMPSGAVESGVEYIFPIEGWTDTEVFEFLAKNGVALPESYAYVNTSLDCQHCTGYLDENAGKFAYMEQKHPKLNDVVKRRVIYLLQAANSEAKHLRAIVD